VENVSLLKKLSTYLFLLIVGVVSLYPFYWMLIGSTLDDSEIFRLPPHYAPGSHLMENIKGLAESIPLWQGLWNSIFIAVIYTVLTVYLSAIAGYAFAKFDFKGKTAIFLIVLLTMMLPPQVTMIPLFKMMTLFGWQNQAQAVIIPALANAFGVFFMRQNMLGVPTEMIEAARIDGSGEISIFHRIILPTSLPPLAALTILSFIQQWGNFMWPLITLQDQSKTTLPVMLSMLVAPGQVIHYGQVLAGTVIGIMPVLVIFLIFQKYFIAGIYGGSVKG
jgi:lactose/L-arabinose transport system permease protein